MRRSGATDLVAAALLLAAGIGAGSPAAAGDAEASTIVLDGVEWALETNGGYIPWPDAVAYCDGLEQSGRDDWRLPSLAELERLHDPETETGIRAPFRTDACCLWSGESLLDRPADDMDEIAGRPDMYHWGYMFDGAQRYYAVHLFEDGQALCMRDAD